MRLPGLLLLFALLLVPACGDADTVRAPKPKPVDLGKPIRTRAIGREVWVPFDHPSHAGMFGNIRLTSREETLAFVTERRQEVLDGDDLGDVAYNNSFAPGRFVGGYTGVVVAPARTDRDRAMLALPEGQPSAVFELDHGFWFGVPLAAESGAALRRQYDHADTIAARARLIHVHYAFAYPRRVQFDNFPKERAIAKAKEYIARIQAGEDFDELARKVSNDKDGRSRGGRMLQPAAKHGDPPGEWIQWRRSQDRAWYFYPVLEAVLETAPVGRVMPEPVVSRYGVDVILVLERRGPDP